MNFIYVFIFVFSVQCLFGQQEIFSKSLKDYGVQINIGSPYYKKVNFKEMETIYKKNGLDFNNYLKEKNVDAWFIYIPAKENVKKMDDQVTITVTIRKAEKTDTITQKKMDTISTAVPFFLNNLPTNTTESKAFNFFYDRNTHASLSKNSFKLMQIKKGKTKFPEPVESKRKVFVILQTFIKNELLFEIEYRCYDDLSYIYFPVFEKIVPTLKWE